MCVEVGLINNYHDDTQTSKCENLLDRFPIKNGLKHEDVLLPMLFNFASEHAIPGVQANQTGLKLLMMLIYWVGAYIL